MDMKRRINKIQIARHIVQIVLFFLLPGIYMLAFGELKGLYISIVNGSFNFPYTLYGASELIIVIVLTVLFGRFFCGWVCAFGTYGEFLHELSRRVFRIKFKIGLKADKVLKYFKYVILVFLIVFVWTFGSELFLNASPWDAFAYITDLPEAFGLLAAGFVLLLFITVGSLFVERFFCRYLCPLGAVFAIVSRISVIKLKMPKDSCRSCTGCTKACAMGLELKKMDRVRGGECINCMKCVEACPRKNAVPSVMGKNMKAPLLIALVLIAGAGIYFAGQTGADALSEKRDTVSIPLEAVDSAMDDDRLYEDGVYTGTGIGYRGRTTEVSVTIENGVITSVETVSYGDDKEFYERAESSVVYDILSTQSTNVDAVTGATYSRDGIVEAVEDALAQAMGEPAAEKADETESAGTSDGEEVSEEGEKEGKHRKNSNSKDQ